MSGRSSSVEHARALALTLDIPLTSFAGRERPAAVIMAHLVEMASVVGHARRRAYGNEILQNASFLMPDTLPQNREFTGKVQMLVAQMQELPAWSSRLAVSNETLVSRYTMAWVVWAA